MTYLETQLGPQNLTIGGPGPPGPPWIHTLVDVWVDGWMRGILSSH